MKNDSKCKLMFGNVVFSCIFAAWIIDIEAIIRC